MNGAAGAVLEREATQKPGRALRHYPIKAEAGFQTVKLPKGAKIHGVQHHKGEPHIVTEHDEDMTEFEHTLLMVLTGDGAVPDSATNYLGAISADPSDANAPAMHVFNCGQTEPETVN